MPSIDLPERVLTAPPFDIGTRMGYRGYTYSIARVRLQTQPQHASTQAAQPP